MNVKILIVKRAGGSRGNSPVGTNFGSVGNPAPQKLRLRSGTFATHIVHRSGALMSYAIEWAEIPFATRKDILFLIAQGNWALFTEGNYSIVEGDACTPNGGWIIPRNTGSLNGCLLPNWVGWPAHREAGEQFLACTELDTLFSAAPGTSKREWLEVAETADHRSQSFLLAAEEAWGDYAAYAAHCKAYGMPE